MLLFPAVTKSPGWQQRIVKNTQISIGLLQGHETRDLNVSLNQKRILTLTTWHVPQARHPHLSRFLDGRGGLSPQFADKPQT
jgi:hypothetical protein